MTALSGLIKFSWWLEKAKPSAMPSGKRIMDPVKRTRTKIIKVLLPCQWATTTDRAEATTALFLTKALLESLEFITRMPKLKLFLSATSRQSKLSKTTISSTPMLSLALRWCKPTSKKLRLFWSSSSRLRTLMNLAYLSQTTSASLVESSTCRLRTPSSRLILSE